jgi:hypothetical protein
MTSIQQKASALDESNLVGNIKSISVSGQTDISLLLTVGSDESVDLGSVNIIKLLDGILDLSLVGLDINEEDEGVIILELLHGSLSVKGLTNDAVLVHARSVGDGLAAVLGSTSKLESLGQVEGGGSADLALSLALGTLKGSLLGIKSLVLSNCTRENG